MQVTETLTEGLKREFRVTVPAADLDARVTGRLTELKDTIQLRGFRPGKVPISHLRKVYGRSVMAETVETMIRELNAKIVEERGFKLAMEPKVSMADEPTDLDQVVAGQSDLPIRCHWKCLHTRTPHNQGEKKMNENTKFGSMVSNEPIQEGLSFEEWKEYGRNLGRIEKIYMWKVGEWWTYGEINYGEKTSITKSDDWDGLRYQTCADVGWVFKKFHFSRRHENLSWSHHREVAGLDEEDADRFLNDAITHKWSRKELRKQVSDFNGWIQLPSA